MTDKMMRGADASRGRFGKPKNQSVKSQKLKQQRTKAVRLPRNSSEIDLTIKYVGSRGDGIGTARYTVKNEKKDWQVYVPGSLEGEQVRVKPRRATSQGLTAELVELITLNLTSVPVCDVFAGLNGCGGCSLARKQSCTRLEAGTPKCF